MASPGGTYIEMLAADLLPVAFEYGNDVVLVNGASSKVFVITREEFLGQPQP